MPKRTVVSLIVAGLLCATTSFANALVPFKTLRGGTHANGTMFVGGAGFTVTHTSTGRYHIAFPTGTWNSSGTACFFVPQVQTVFTNAVAAITAWATYADGSGFVDIAISSGADAPMMLVFTSVNC